MLVLLLTVQHAIPESSQAMSDLHSKKLAH